MAYRLRKNDHGAIGGCECCKSEVPTDHFSSDRKELVLCRLCANSIGNAADTVTKDMLCQMLNELVLIMKENK